MNMPDVTTPKSFVTLIPTATSNMKAVTGITESQNLDFDAVGVEVVSHDSPERRILHRDKYDTLPRHHRDSESENPNLRRTI